VDPARANKYCDRASLHNESDVEQHFIAPLLRELGYEPEFQVTKTHLTEESIRKGRKKKGYSPDYICYTDKAHKKPVLVIDAKHPEEDAEDGVNDAYLYTAILRRKLSDPKPMQFCIGINGERSLVYQYEKDTPQYDLNFDDFIDGNPKFEALKNEMNISAREKAFSLSAEPFEFKKPDLHEVPKIFEKCHKAIWRKEISGPAPAFYEFAKLMFVKLNHDKKIREDPKLKKLIDAEEPLPQDKVIFSLKWINKNEDADPSPINSLFRRLRDDLEKEIMDRKKKRIFEDDEEIQLKPDTIKAVVQFLEHFDLYGIDDDLNGRLFETFLSATMRGKELGQFFTPRTVVEFMTKIADLKADDKHIDTVIDACCGTGGFLIEAMAIMTRNVKDNKALGGGRKDEIMRLIRDESLFGIDGGKDPPIARIARINMYLHGDGGSKIFFSDALDREIQIEQTLTPELKTEREELKKVLIEDKKTFDVVLTNPPFSMPYKKAEADQKRILEQYSLAFSSNKKGTRVLKASLKSNVMFIQRYHEVLKPGGKLITVIDESILNTDTDKDCRDFIYDNFLIKAIISLPRMTFLRAGANVKTSIMYLEKKRDSKEEQPYTFYARCENSGFNPRNLRKVDRSSSDLDAILQKYIKFIGSGKL
jgi:type I restriction enzyme M protein